MALGDSSDVFRETFLERIVDVHFGSNGFLVFSGNGDPANSDAFRGLASEDGSNWVDVEFPIGAMCGAYGDGRWIISDGQGSASVSKDAGKTWKDASIPTNFTSLAYIKPDKKAKKGIFAGFSGPRPGVDASVYTSTDSGETWQIGPDLSTSSSFFNIFFPFLAGAGKVFIIAGGADGVVQPDPFFGGDTIQLPFPFPVYSGGWQTASAFSSVDWSTLTIDPEGEGCSIDSTTVAYDDVTKQYKMWGFAASDGEAIMSVTSSDGISWNSPIFEYNDGVTIVIAESSAVGPISVGSSAGGNGVLLTSMSKGLFAYHVDGAAPTVSGVSLTSGVLINGVFNGAPGDSSDNDFVNNPFGAEPTLGGAAFSKDANGGNGLFALGFHMSEGSSNTPQSAKISTSAEGDTWDSTEISIAPRVIAVGDVSGFLAIGDPADTQPL